MIASCRRAAVRWVEGAGPEDGLIFPRPGGAAWTVHDWRNWHRRVYRDAATDAGITDDLRAYRLRASCASLLLWEGRSLTYVAKQLGHGVDVLARHYAGVIEELEHADRGELRSAAEAIKAARAEVASRPLVRDLFA